MRGSSTIEGVNWQLSNHIVDLGKQLKKQPSSLEPRLAALANDAVKGVCCILLCALMWFVTYWLHTDCALFQLR